ncbi:sigma-54 factor interaction domain-containing protein [Peribacillus aracenensis]|uniref:sigma-54 factor interaction domain-containing protein n=1 Tax=Peribacillus aracenensis TaxID=2976708 RepID=UPI0021A5FD2D|nr:sigma-54 factor interaction domain-containing protein [Peribacillus sp. BBB004]
MNVRYVKPFLSLGRIQTLSQGFQTELEVARIAAQSSANVLILGETGTGKDVIAQTIHNKVTEEMDLLFLRELNLVFICFISNS